LPFRGGRGRHGTRLDGGRQFQPSCIGIAVSDKLTTSLSLAFRELLVRRFLLIASFIVFLFSFPVSAASGQSMQLFVDLSDAPRNLYHSG